MIKTFRSEITIGAPPEHVWAVLNDFGQYGAWNPFIRRIDGVAGLNVLLGIRVRLAGVPTRFSARIDRYRQGKTLGWHAELVGGLLKAHHWFELAPLDYGQTRFVHLETFQGTFALPALLLLSGALRQGYEKMNRALKERSEKM